jgi:hypothetical protein
VKWADLNIFDARVKFGIEEENILETGLTLSLLLEKEMKIRIGADDVLLNTVHDKGVGPVSETEVERQTERVGE